MRFRLTKRSVIEFLRFRTLSALRAAVSEPFPAKNFEEWLTKIYYVVSPLFSSSSSEHELASDHSSTVLSNLNVLAATVKTAFAVGKTGACGGSFSMVRTEVPHSAVVDSGGTETGWQWMSFS